MTWKDVCEATLGLVVRWMFGLGLAALGTYMLVEKIAVWPAIGVLAFGVFILRPADLVAFGNYLKTNAAQYFTKPPPPEG